MYLVDTNIISEQRKCGRADPGVLAFFEDADAGDKELFVSVVTLGELRRGSSGRETTLTVSTHVPFPP